MPVWHELTKKMQEDGSLRVIGLVQEQHPDRAMLFQQWQQHDWPILWDPFNLTGSHAVPRFVFVDEFGIVRKINPRRQTFEEKWLRAEFEPPLEAVTAPPSTGKLLELEDENLAAADRAYFTALSDFLWRRAPRYDAALEVLDQRAGQHPDDALTRFRTAVAHRLRYDSTASRPDDFQAAVDGWTEALALVPRQYIWRRRIQQYGPRLDKPYPFYDWVKTARAAILERGEEPHPLVATLTPTERAGRRSQPSGASEAREPDPERQIPSDESWTRVESAVAFPTGKDKNTACVHLAFRLAPGGNARWNNEAEPMRVWLQPPTAEEGTLDAQLLEHVPPAAATSKERRCFTLELTLDPECTETRLRGYALFHACAEENGTCQFLRRDFEVRIER